MTELTLLGAAKTDHLRSGLDRKVAEKMKIFIMASALSLGLVLVARADDVDDLFFAVTNIYGVSGETTPSGGGYAERLFVPEHE